MLKNCIGCNKEFKTKPSHASWRKFCSQQCASISRKSLKIEIKCHECDKPYFILPCRKDKTKFCSVVCSRIGKIKTRKYTPKGSREIVSIKCERCCKFFDHNLAKKNRARYCSVECIKRPRESAICLNCKNSYEYIPRNRHGSIKFCSKNCSSQFFKGTGFWATASNQDIRDYLSNIFQVNVEKLKNGCWRWIKGVYGSGYGAMTYMGKSMKAHRMSYMFHNNEYELAPNIMICHRCDHKWCCAPDHLFKGTALDNMRDMINKGRQNNPRGEKASGAKMSEETAREVINLLENNIKMTKIASMLGVGKGAVNSIKRNRSWKHLSRKKHHE